MQPTKKILFQITRIAEGREPDALPLPAYQTQGSAGLDLSASIRDEILLCPGEHVLIPTGFAISLPQGYEAQVRPRSGLAWKHGITVLNSPGTVDSDYRGEIKVVLIHHGQEPVVIRRGDRIAQMVIAPVIHADLEVVPTLDVTERGAGGYGSTGRLT